MPRRKRGNEKGRKERRKKKKKRGFDWTYYGRQSEFESNGASDEDRSNQKPNQICDDNDRGHLNGNVSESENSDTDEESSSVDIYRNFVESSMAIAADSSTVFKKLQQQKAREEAGNSDSSAGEMGEDEGIEDEVAFNAKFSTKNEHYKLDSLTQENVEEEDLLVRKRKDSSENGTEKSRSAIGQVGLNGEYDSAKDPYLLRWFNENTLCDNVRKDAISNRELRPVKIDLFGGENCMELKCKWRGADALLKKLQVGKLSDLCIKPRVLTRWKYFAQNDPSCLARNAAGLTQMQAAVLPLLNSYCDFVFTDRKIIGPQRGRAVVSGSAVEIQQLIALHLVNHITKNRDVVLHNNKQIHQLRELKKREKKSLQVEQALKKNKSSRSSSELLVSDNALRPSTESEDNPRDQGLSRCKVLLVLPTRSCAEKYVQLILSLLPRCVKIIHNKKRFDNEFGVPGMNEEEIKAACYTRDGRRRAEDWIELFARNSNDCFTVGIAFSKKEVKLYSDFYASDLVIASPLGLRMAMGASGDEEAASVDAGFLSSIEIAVVDQVAALEMQNKEHLRAVLRQLNCRPSPKQTANIDFSRVRETDLEGIGCYLRQTILMSCYPTPELNYLCGAHCGNSTGLLKISRKYFPGSIEMVVPEVRQLFRRVEVSTLADVADTRFNYFKAHMFEALCQVLRGISMDGGEILSPQKESGTLLYIPSYFDFLQIQRLFKEEGLSPAICCEYTESAEQTRARGRFFNGEKRVLLYTERNHFYQRFRLRGAKHIIFYAPPTDARFYTDMLNMISVGERKSNVGYGAIDEPSATVLFTKYDALSLERIVGSARFKRMIKGKAGKTTYLFT